MTTMDQDTLQRIERIETKGAALRAQIATLEQELANLYSAEDEGYANYLTAYRSHYSDDPLSIRRYYELSEEMDEINTVISQADEHDFDDLWHRFGNRLQYLERVLAA